MTDEKIKNSRELEFAVFCIENVAAKLGVNAERVYQAFTEKMRVAPNIQLRRYPNFSRTDKKAQTSGEPRVMQQGDASPPSQ